MTPLGPEARSLLAAARGARPAPAAKARVDARLVAKLGAVAVPVAIAPTALAAPVAAAPAAAGPIAAVGGAVFGVKGALLAAALVVGAGVVVVRSVVPSGGAPVPAGAPSARFEATSGPTNVAPPAPGRARASDVEAAASSSSAPLGVEATPEEVPRSPVVVRAPPRANASASSGALGRDSALMTQALRSLRQGDPDAALRSLDALGSARPSGPLAEERLAARVLALCAAGRTDDAKAAAADFLARFPGSLHAGQVRASCAR